MAKRKRATKAAKMSPYSAAKIFTHIQAREELNDGIKKFFRYDCLFWKHLHDYINHCDEGQCPFVDLWGPIQHGRGLSGITLDKVYANPPGAREVMKKVGDVIMFCVKVAIWDEECQHSYGETGSVVVPVDLVTDFSVDAFEEWIKEEEKKHKKRRYETATYELQELYKKYPEVKTMAKVLKALGSA